MSKGNVVIYGLMALSLLLFPHTQSLAQTAAPSADNSVVPETSQAAVPESGGKGIAALQRTAANKQYLFIFFNNGQNEQTDTMWAVFHSALTKLKGRAEGVPINISDPLEQELVQRFNLTGAPMPLVLVLAPNGAIMGGFPTKWEEAQLLEAFGTPAMEETLKGLQERRLVLLCIQNQTTQQNDAAMSGVNELRADPQIGQAVRVVMANPADPNESKLFTQLKIDPSLNVAQTVMLAPPGAAVGKFMGGTTKTMLLSKLQSSGGCGPGGCAGGKCGPAAAGPQAQSSAPPQQQSQSK